MLDIIILNWNAPDDTLSCLRQLTRWRELTPRIWVVDNGSTDDSVARIRAAFPQVHVLAGERNLGFAGGNNLALRRAMAAGAAYILLLNNDATISEADLRRLLTHLEQHPRLGFVGPTLWNAQSPEQLLSAGGRDIARHLVTHRRDLPTGETLRPVAYVPGTCLLIRAAALQTVGFLDEAYFFSGEVADLCMRGHQAGWNSAIAADARAFHNVARSSEMRERLHVYYILRNRFRFTRKFHRRERWRWLPLWIGYGVYIAALAALHGKFRRARAALLGVWDGLRGRYGGQNERVLGG